MASFVIYDNTKVGISNQRVSGMKEAAERILRQMSLGSTPERIIIGTLDELILHQNFDVKFTDRATGDEFVLVSVPKRVE